MKYHKKDRKKGKQKESRNYKDISSTTSSSGDNSNSSSSSQASDIEDIVSKFRKRNSKRKDIDRAFGSVLKRDYNRKFDSASSKTPIERFFYRIEEIAKDHGVHREQLVGQLGSILQNEAVDFYWTFRERNGEISWSKLKKAFIYRFSESRTQEDVWNSLESRKQRTNEPFVEYYNAVLEISMSLKKPIRDSKLIRLLKDNMIPSLKSQLAGKVFSSLPKLINKCISIEETWKRIKINTHHQGE